MYYKIKEGGQIDRENRDRYKDRALRSIQTREDEIKITIFVEGRVLLKYEYIFC